MAKKRQIEDDNIILIHAKKPKHLTTALKGLDDSSTYLLSKDEQKLFRLDRWFKPKSHLRRSPADVASMKDYYTCALSFIRTAYNSIRGAGSEDVIKVLKDKVAMSALIDFAACFRRMKEFSFCMNAMRTDLSMKLKIDGTTAFVYSDDPGPSSNLKELNRSLKGKCPYCSLIHAQVSLMPSAKPRVLETSGNSKVIGSSLERIGGCTQFSIKVYNMLLILSKILTQMEIQSEDEIDEGNEHAELTEMIRLRLNLLRTEMEQEERLLIELINSECNSECASACDNLRSRLLIKVLTSIEGCDESLSGNKKIYEAFQEVVELMNDIRERWHTFKRKRPSRDVLMVWRKNIQLEFDAVSVRSFALLEEHSVLPFQEEH